MTTRFPIVAAMAAAVCLATPALASDPRREPVRASIGYGDLDLTRASGRATLQRRIDRAVRHSCTSKMSGLTGLADIARCRREMRADAEMQVAAIAPSTAPIAVAASR